MGDGQHIWASAEWLLMLIHCFVREEGQQLVIGSGIPQQWLAQEEPLKIGPVQTPWGPIEVEIMPTAEAIDVQWKAQWRTAPASVVIAFPSMEKMVLAANANGRATVQRS